MSNYYIASCVFTSRFPELSLRIQEYVKSRFGFPIVRCCVPNYKIREFEDKMPEGTPREEWRKLKDCADFAPGDTVWSLCHNCSNIIEEMHPETAVRSLWELVDSDPEFMLPELEGLEVTVQDCWRARERKEEHEAVRSLLKKSGAKIVELHESPENCMFCGNSLYRAQPPRNPKLAPRHYVQGAEGLFIPHTPEEQKAIMNEYCSRFTTDTVVCYCHYCLEGLLLGGANGVHLAQLLFS